MASIDAQVITGFPLRAKAVSTSDTEDLTDYTGNPVAATIYAGGAGVIRVIPAEPDGSSSTVDVTVVAGGTIPFRVKRVYTTALTASELIQIW